MNNVFSNPHLMNKVRAELIAVAEKDEPYCDPMFGSLFTDIVISTPHIVPRYSCQGHLSLAVVNDKDEVEIIEKDSSYKENDDDSDTVYMITNPYIYFLCTKKGKMILDDVFETLIANAKIEGFPLHIYGLTIDYYDAPDEPLIEHTGRVTLTVDGNWVFKHPDRQQKVIKIIKDSIYQVLNYVVN